MSPGRSEVSECVRVRALPLMPYENLMTALFLAFKIRTLDLSQSGPARAFEYGTHYRNGVTFDST